MFWGLLPVAGVQGLSVRQKALRLAPPPGPASGRAEADDDAGPALDLLALGDSIIAGIGAERWVDALPARLAASLAELNGREVRWSADGASGDAITDLLRGLAAISADQRADLVLISIGVNDVTGLSGTRPWRRRAAALADRLRQRWPDALIVFAGLPQMEYFPLPPQPLRHCLGLRARRLDRLLAAEIAPRERMLHIETRIDPRVHGFCADGFHPSVESYAIWGRELAERLVPLLGTPGDSAASLRGP